MNQKDGGNHEWTRMHTNGIQEFEQEAAEVTERTGEALHKVTKDNKEPSAARPQPKEDYHGWQDKEKEIPDARLPEYHRLGCRLLWTFHSRSFL